jgi:hypothetical protein
VGRAIKLDITVRLKPGNREPLQHGVVYFYFWKQADGYVEPLKMVMPNGEDRWVKAHQRLVKYIADQLVVHEITVQQQRRYEDARLPIDLLVKFKNGKPTFITAA